MPSSSTILLVDDNLGALEALRGALEGQGYRLMSASSGPEALEMLTQVLPDLILLDVMMPGMDGFEVCRRIRERPGIAEVPVIMVTALEDRDSRVRGFEAGADDFVSKPFDRRELRARVKTVTSLNRFRRLAEERGKVEKLVTLSPDGILLLDGSGNIQMANPAFSQMVGVAEPDLIGRNFLGFIAPDDLQHCTKCFEQVMTEEIPSQRVETRIRREGGGTLVVESSVGYCLWDGAPACELVIRDVTERKRLEGTLQRIQRLDAIGRTVSAVSHDFNNYLTVIQANADLLMLDLPDEGEMRQSAQEITLATRKASAVTQQLLTFARQQPNKSSSFDINAAVEELSPMLKRLLGKSIQFQTDLAPDMSQVKLDRTQLEQLIVNLTVNARDAMESGGTFSIKTAEIHLDKTYVSEHPDARTGAHVVLVVEDTGQGIDAETRQHIFEPFFSTKEEGKGTGLGLSTVHGIARQAGGHVRVDSEPGQGTTFHIYFPVSEGESDGV